jgi:ABC-type Mn2+/Zn2+ transport system permease subunit
MLKYVLIFTLFTILICFFVYFFFFFFDRLYMFRIGSFIQCMHQLQMLVMSCHVEKVCINLGSQ